MTLQQLEYVVAVYRNRHFVQAARSCGVTQPTLSAMVQKLEQELGVTLFRRGPQQVTVTPVGEQIAEQAAKVLSAAGRITQLADEERNLLHGTLNVGVLPTIAPYLLPRFFPALCQELPDVQVRATELRTEQLLAELRNGTLDVAIATLLPEVEPFQPVPLYYEPFMAYVSRQNALFAQSRIKTEQLQHVKLLLLDEGHCFGRQLERFCHLPSASYSRKAFRLEGLETFMRMVEVGDGLTIIPQLCALQLTSQQQELVRPFAVPEPVRTIVLLRRADFARQGLLAQLVERIRACVPPELLTLPPTAMRV